MIFSKVPLKYRIHISFIIVFVLFFSLSIYLLNKKKKDVLSLAKKNAELLAETIKEELNIIIYEQVNDIRIFSQMTNLSKYAEESNLEYANMADRQKYIFDLDNQWKSNKTSPEIEKILNNVPSETLKKFTALKSEYYGYAIIPELFITNKYGALVGSSERTTDFNQADENWFNQTMRAENYLIEDVKYDRSAHLYTIDIIVQLFDQKHNITGLVKALFNIQKIVNVMESVKKYSFLKNMNIELLTKDQLVIYSTAKTNQILQKKFDEDYASYLGSEASRYGFIEKIGGVQYLVVKSKAAISENIKGLEWNLIIKYELKGILKDYYQFMAILFISSALIFIIMMLISFFLYRSIDLPIKQIVQFGENVKAGNLETLMEVKIEEDFGKIRELINFLITKIKDLSQKNK